MKILFVSALLPYPLVSGGQVRVFNLLKRLSVNHQITLAAFIRDKSEKKYLSNLNFLSDIRLVFRGKRFRPEYILRTLTGPYPWLMTSYDNPVMKQALTQLLAAGKYDLIHMEPFYTYPSLPTTELPLIIAEHNIEYQVYRSFAGRYRLFPVRQFLDWESNMIRRWETKIIHECQRVIAVSDTDAEYFRTINPNVSVVPNGVDTGYFTFREHALRKDRLQILFFGNFDWLPNREAVKYLLERIWPDIGRKHRHASLRIVGRNLPVWLRQNRSDRVSFKSDVPDIRDEINLADCLLAPFHIGGGTKYKILESMASGLPVITSKAGISGLPLTDKIHVRVADSPDDYVRFVTDLQENHPYFRQMTRNSRKLVEAEFSWEKIADRLDETWKKMKL